MSDILVAVVKEGGIEKGLEALLTEAERVKAPWFYCYRIRKTKNKPA